MEFLNSQLFGIIIGGVLTAGFSAFIEWLRFQREKKQKNLDERKQCYLEILKIYYLEKEEEFVKNQLKPNIREEISQKRRDYLPLVQITASKKVLDKWNEVGHVLKGTFNDKDLINTIRAELEIKD